MSHKKIGTWDLQHYHGLPGTIIRSRGEETNHSGMLMYAQTYSSPPSVRLVWGEKISKVMPGIHMDGFPIRILAEFRDKLSEYHERKAESSRPLDPRVIFRDSYIGKPDVERSVYITPGDVLVLPVGTTETDTFEVCEGMDMLPEHAAEGAKSKRRELVRDRMRYSTGRLAAQQNGELWPPFVF